MRYAVAESAAYLAYVSIYAASKVQNLPARTIFKKEGVFLTKHTLLNNKVTFYQLAFLTPGIRPAEAISRNWIRLMPN